MRVITLTDEQAITLHMYLMITTQYRKKEQEACQKLSLEKLENGEARFPAAKNNADWWGKAIKAIEDIEIMIDSALTQTSTKT
jgi:hypothetical protein